MFFIGVYFCKLYLFLFDMNLYYFLFFFELCNPNFFALLFPAFAIALANSLFNFTLINSFENSLSEKSETYTHSPLSSLIDYKKMELWNYDSQIIMILTVEVGERRG